MSDRPDLYTDNQARHFPRYMDGPANDPGPAVNAVAAVWRGNSTLRNLDLRGTSAGAVTRAANVSHPVCLLCVVTLCPLKTPG